MVDIAGLIAAYLLGALAWSLWAGQLRGIDIRRHGSGNLGATNVYRVLGWKAGLLVLLLDIGKGTAAVLLALALRPDAWAGAYPAAAGLAAVGGHMLTPFAGFRGGKGVATGLGVFLALAPEAGLVAFLVWLGVVLLTGWISLGSGAGALALPVAAHLTRDALGPRYPWVLGLATLVALLVLVRHRANWRRIAAGREQAIWERRPETPAGGAAPRGEVRP